MRYFMAVLGVLVAVATATPVRAQLVNIYEQNFDAAALGVGFEDGALIDPPGLPDNWYAYGGDAFYHFQVGVDAGGVGGTNAFFYNSNGALTLGTTYYWYGGMGRAGTSWPGVRARSAEVTLSLDIAVVGNNGDGTFDHDGNPGTPEIPIAPTPVEINLNQFDDAGGDDDPDPGGGTSTWTATWHPALSPGYNHITLTLDSGAQIGTFNPLLPLNIGNFAIHSGAFALDDGNSVHIDNVVVTAMRRPGDVNFDGVVDIFDVNLVSAHWNDQWDELADVDGDTVLNGPQNRVLAGDANDDVIVDIFDVNLISSNWTGGGGATVAPEPSSLVLVVAGAGGLLCCIRGLRRRQV